MLIPPRIGYIRAQSHRIKNYDPFRFLTSHTRTHTYRKLDVPRGKVSEGKKEGKQRIPEKRLIKISLRRMYSRIRLINPRPDNSFLLEKKSSSCSFLFAFSSAFHPRSSFRPPPLLCLLLFQFQFTKERNSNEISSENVRCSIALLHSARDRASRDVGLSFLVKEREKMGEGGEGKKKKQACRCVEGKGTPIIQRSVWVPLSYFNKVERRILATGDDVGGIKGATLRGNWILRGFDWIKRRRR